MDFLTTALYTQEADGAEKLAGALLTRFDPTNLVSRAKVIFASKEVLASGESIHPSGFKMDEYGVLLSDTSSPRALMADDLASYVGTTVCDEPAMPAPGLLDFLLYGYHFGGSIVVNGDEVFDGADPILMKMSSLHVSASSFNVYGRYKNEQGRFRTFSVIDPFIIKATSLLVAVPETQLENYAPVRNLMVDRGTCTTLEDQRLFQVAAELDPSYTAMGEAFCNYLAYNVAYNGIGSKICDQFLEGTKYRPPKDVQPEDDGEGRDPYRGPRPNVSIVSTCRTPRVEEILSVMDNLPELKERVKDEEAYITFVWLQNIFRGSDKFEGQTLEDRLAAACASLKCDADANMFHFAIELLAQRYYIYQMGWQATPLEQILKGGGVNGVSIKKFTR